MVGNRLTKRLEETYPAFRMKSPTDFPWGREVHFIDPAGVCWHVTETDQDPFFSYTDTFATARPFSSVPRNVIVMVLPSSLMTRRAVPMSLRA